jgi:hypothetical protein
LTAAELQHYCGGRYEKEKKIGVQIRLVTPAILGITYCHDPFSFYAVAYSYKYNS